MHRPSAGIRPPTKERIHELAEQHFLHLTDEETADFAELIPPMLDAFERLEAIPEPRTDVDYGDRGPGYRPGLEEDPLNAFVTKCRVEGSGSGSLAGYEVGVKDNVAVAGIEMTVGTDPMTGFVPRHDATVVTRLLDAGATIVGKLNMESMAFSSSGELSATGAVLNPRNTDYLAGGSSSGSAAAVAAGEVDIALGTDQAGSLRIPAALCGCIGLKPTFGLVPYTNIVGQGYTFDHVGPMTSTVTDCARVLDVLAGYDPKDPRQDRDQVPSPTAEPFAGALDSPDEEPVTVGVVDEGFDWEDGDPTVDGTVRQGLAEWASQDGVETIELSIPEHRDGVPIWLGVMVESVAAYVRSEGQGYFVQGEYDTAFLRGFARARRAEADGFPPTLKLALVLGEYLADEYHGRYHAQAQNLRDLLRDGYDDALDEVDVLAMPTTVRTAFEAAEEVSRTELIDRAFSLVENTAAFDMTGHPAISLPCGQANGLPVGLMLVGERFEDARLLQTAQSFEQAIDINS